MAVTDAEERTGNRHGEEQRRARHQLPAVDVSAARRAGRSGGELPFLGLRHADDAEEGPQLNRVAELVRPGPPVPIQLPQEPFGLTARDPQRPREGVVAPPCHGEAPIAGCERLEGDGQHVPRLRSPHLDGTGEAVAPPVREHQWPHLPGKGLRLQVAGGVKGLHHHCVAGIHCQHCRSIAGKDLGDSAGVHLELVNRHRRPS